MLLIYGKDLKNNENKGVIPKKNLDNIQNKISHTGEELSVINEIIKKNKKNKTSFKEYYKSENIKLYYGDIYNYLEKKI